MQQAGGVDLDMLKAAASTNNAFPKNRSKKVLIDALVVIRKQALALQTPARSTYFVKDKDTFPRLCNLIMKHPNAVRQSFGAATRDQLQHKEGPTPNRQIWRDLEAEFNDYDVHSGGLCKKRDLYDNASIDPERPNLSGKFRADAMVSLWKDIKAPYLIAKSRYEASGHHDEDSFPAFAHEKTTDVVYLFDSLRTLSDETFEKFVAEDNIIASGFDTGNITADTGSANKRQKTAKQGISELVQLGQVSNNFKEQYIRDLGPALSAHAQAERDVSNMQKEALIESVYTQYSAIAEKIDKFSEEEKKSVHGDIAIAEFNRVKRLYDELVANSV